ncbi:MAG: bifunctional 5,10-methylene-tetrahydrofolate dehydrogenase/5,10-methylene-tetrahydrofolate cyclohydrolase [Candidatus Parcubacteria bacterium]|nr:bifunctional 5,10-methylene-tetrahydrofolate dehydrogenase/5,10-methylene-tetrahydrofolate cyclohydrolase [Candidatus Parcubacteria bacterium]
MPAQLIDAKKIADEILLDIKKQVTKLETKPGLAAILIGDNPASKLYLKLKEKACQKVGIDFFSYFLDKNCPEEKVLEVINFLNNDQAIKGIILQLPLPEKFNQDKLIKAIKPSKDVDGFHPQSKVISPNVLGIIELIKSTKVDLKNKKVIILSNSEIFSQPFKKLLPESKIEYVNPKSHISDLISHTSKADVLIVAIGQAKFIKPNMVKKDSIIIDVGINKVKGKTIGDVDPEVDKVVAFRSPVPGGVGPMTVAMLLQNLLQLINIDRK